MPEFPLPASYWPAVETAPLRRTTIGSILRDAAERDGGAIALIDGNPDSGARRSWTYRQLLADAERAARAMLTRFEPGERIAVWAPNCPEWILLDFAAALAGLVLVTVNPAYQAEELGYVLGHSEADGLFLADTHAGRDLHAILAEVRGQLPRLRAVFSLSDWATFTAAGDDPQAAGRPLPLVAPGDIAHVLYTSGTTGRPKGAELTHRGLTNNARLMAEAVGLDHTDLLVNPMPLFHVGGCGLFLLAPVQAGAPLVLMPRFSPALQLELIEAYRGTVLCGVPTMLTALLHHPDLAKRDVSSLRRTLTGGAISPPALVRQVEERLGVIYCISLAQTESSCSITITTEADSADDRAMTVGRPLPNTEVRIAGLTAGKTVPCGTVGEVCTRGYLVMSGYLNAPEATAAAIDSDGWLHTGDLGTMDDRGYVSIAGRLKEMITRGGENIYPREIEEVLISHPNVAEAAVLGVPDSYYGEIVAAAIRPAGPVAAGHGGDLATELAGYCRARLAAYKVPVTWLVTDAFPLTASGKIRKDALREQLASAQGQ